MKIQTPTITDFTNATHTHASAAQGGTLSVGGDVASDSIWDAKGDLAVGTAANKAVVMSAGTAGQVLTVNGTTATGLEWKTPTGGTATGGVSVLEVQVFS